MTGGRTVPSAQPATGGRAHARAGEAAAASCAPLPGTATRHSRQPGPSPCPRPLHAGRTRCWAGRGLPTIALGRRLWKAPPQAQPAPQHVSTTATRAPYGLRNPDSRGPACTVSLPPGKVPADPLLKVTFFSSSRADSTSSDFGTSQHQGGRSHLRNFLAPGEAGGRYGNHGEDAERPPCREQAGERTGQESEHRAQPQVSHGERGHHPAAILVR